MVDGRVLVEAEVRERLGLAHRRFLELGDYWDAAEGNVSDADFELERRLRDEIALCKAWLAQRETIQAVNDSALGWHSGEDGKARALNVIAVWTAEALAGRVHPSVAAVSVPPNTPSDEKE